MVVPGSMQNEQASWKESEEGTGNMAPAAPCRYLISTSRPVSRSPTERRQDICVHTPPCQSTDPSFSSWRSLEEPELRRTPGALRLPQCHEALGGQH